MQDLDTLYGPLKVVALAAAALALAGSTAAAADSSSKPNVILVLTDDQGYGDLHCHGNAFIRTPHMDKLYSQSVRLTDFHVMTCCAPTRAMLMTGRYPMRTGVWCTVGNTSRLKRGEVTLADVFRTAGYRTGFFGKWHLGDNYPFRPQDRGFDEVLMHGAGGVGNTPDFWANDYFDDTYFRNGKPEKHAGFCTDVWFDEAIKFIEAGKDRPFFCYIPTNAPHLPFVAPKKYLDMYPGEDPAMRGFYAMITNLDDALGRLRRKLAELGIEKDTILLLTTDNGSVIGARKYNAGMRGGKGSQWDGGHRVPLLIHWPKGGLTGPRDVKRIASGIDVLPTLMELCKIKREHGPPLDGISLAPLLRGRTDGWPERTLFVQNQWGSDRPRKWFRTSVMTDQWRLVDNRVLNRIEKDPAQARNSIKDHPDVATRLRAAYDKWWNEVGPTDPGEGKEIGIGADQENPCKLTAHDNFNYLWNHDQVLEGLPAGNHWDVYVERDGEYEFALRRYPVEANAPIRGSIRVPEELKDFNYFHHRGKFKYAMTHSRSRPLAVDSATLAIGSFRQTKDLPERAKAAPDYEVNAGGQVVAVKFRTKLATGKTKLEAWFGDKTGKRVTNAYYVYVTRQ